MESYIEVISVYPDAILKMAPVRLLVLSEVNSKPHSAENFMPTMS